MVLNSFNSKPCNDLTTTMAAKVKPIHIYFHTGCTMQLTTSFFETFIENDLQSNCSFRLVFRSTVFIRPVQRSGHLLNVHRVACVGKSHTFLNSLHYFAGIFKSNQMPDNVFLKNISFMFEIM